MKKNKFTAILAALALFAGTLAGCSQSETSGTPSPNSDSGTSKPISSNAGSVHTISTEVLTDAFASTIFSFPSSVTNSDDGLKIEHKYALVGHIVTAAMDKFDIQYMTGKEAIAQGYLSEDELDDSIDLNYVYCAIISGYVMPNPEYPDYTYYNEEAVKCWMVFDEDDQLQDYDVTLCGDLISYFGTMTENVYYREVT